MLKVTEETWELMGIQEREQSWEIPHKVSKGKKFEVDFNQLAKHGLEEGDEKVK